MPIRQHYVARPDYLIHHPHMHTVSLSDARASLPALIDRATANRAPIAITRRRGEGVVLVAESDWAEVAARLSTPAAPSAER